MVETQPTTHPRDVRPDPDADDRSLGELLGQLSSDFSAFVSTQVELAKTEIRSEATKAARAAGMFGTSGLAGYLSLILLSFAVAWGLAAVMPTGWAFAIVGIVWAAVAAVLFSVGRTQMRAVQPVPPKTKQSIKEDVEWARQQKN